MIRPLTKVVCCSCISLSPTPQKKELREEIELLWLVVFFVWIVVHLVFVCITEPNKLSLLSTA